MLTKQKLQRLAHLQVQICTSDERLRYLADKIQMLSGNRCKTTILVKIHNDDQHEINEGQRTVDRLKAEETIVGPIVTSKPMPPCEIQFSDTLSEPQAIKVLNFLFLQEKSERAEYIKEMETLLKETSGLVSGEPVPNPIMELHLASA